MKKIILALFALIYYNANAQIPYQTGNDLQNRKVVLYQTFDNNHQFYGLGVNGSIFRYQIDNTLANHVFYAGASATTSNELMRITGTGNVGIGITTPNAPLQFSNAAANRKIVLFDANNNDHQYFGLGINASMLRYQVDNSTGVHAFFSGASASTSTELMRIAGNGNVGIGTTAPSEKLHVAGSVRIVDGTEGAGKILTSDANGRGTWTTPAAGGNTSELQKITESSNTGWRILGRDANNYGDIGFSAIDLSRSTTASTTSGATGQDAFATGFGTTASNQVSTAMGFNTIASGGSSTAMGFATIASNLTSTAMGNTTIASGHSSTSMGNGTRATQYASTAMGNFTRATGIVSTATGDEVRAKSFGEFAIGSYNDTLTTVNSTTFAGDNNRIFTVGTGTSAARRTSFVIQQNGNAGIGSSSPNAQLQLGNTITNRKLVLFEVANNDHQYYGLGINNQVFRYQVDNTISSHAFYAGTSTSTSNELMRITGVGNVGIGTTAPSERLHVAGSVRIVDGTQGVGKVLTSDANGKGTWTTPAAGGNTSELQKITEGSNTGWRILGNDAANYGNIGANALDLSRSTLASTTTGATGPDAFAAGFVTTASGTNSTAMGNSTNALGMFSTAMGSGSIASGQSSTAIGNFSRATGVVSIAAGNEVRAKSFGELTVGSFNDTLTTVNSSTFAGDNNRIFTVGTGSSGSARRTSFVVQQNGNVGIGASSPNAQLQLGNTVTNRKVVLFEVANNDHQYYGVGINNQTLRYQVDATNSSHAFFAGASATTSNELMRITGTGNVGIGTTTPTSNLTVAGTPGTTGLITFTGGNYGSHFFIGAAQDTYIRGGKIGSHVYINDDAVIGNVKIGAGGIPTEKLDVTGNLKVNGNICYTGTIGACSDLRYKTNFSKIENPLNKVLALNGLHYDWKVDEFKENNFTKDRQIGFIAQEIEKIFPEMVVTDTKGYKSVDYARLTPVLVEAIKELKTLNDELKNKNEKLESNSQKLEARLDKIEALLNR